MGETVLMGDKEIPAQLEQVIRDALEQAGLAVTQTISIGNGDSFDFTIGNFRLEKNLSAGADGSSIMNMDVSIKDSNASNVDIVFMTSEIRDSRGNGRSCDSPNWCKSLVFMDGIKPGESRTRTSKVRLFSPPGYDNLVTETFLVRGYLDYMVGTGPIYGGLKYNEWVVDLNNKTLTRKY
jgi:hypothetical protein